MVKQIPKKQDVDSLVYKVPKPKLLFGIPVDSSIVILGKIKRNQTLSAILQSFGVSDAKIYTIYEGTSQIQRMIISRNMFARDLSP